MFLLDTNVVSELRRTKPHGAVLAWIRNVEDAELNISAVTLGDGPNSLFTNGGTALMIHAKGDDYKTDPAGNAGDRIACGVISK